MGRPCARRYRPCGIFVMNACHGRRTLTSHRSDNTGTGQDAALSPVGQASFPQGIYSNSCCSCSRHNHPCVAALNIFATGSRSMPGSGRVANCYTYRASVDMLHASREDTPLSTHNADITGAGWRGGGHPRQHMPYNVRNRCHRALRACLDENLGKLGTS